MENLRQEIEILRRQTERHTDDIQQLKEDRTETKIMMKMISESLSELKTMIKEAKKDTKDTGEGDRWKTVMIETIKAIATVTVAVFAAKQF